MDRMRELVNALNAASRAYYLTGNSDLSDAQWDKYYDELIALEAATGQRLPDSPTAHIGADIPLQVNTTATAGGSVQADIAGAPVRGFEPHRHLHRLWSMDKVQSHTELLAWLARCEKLHTQLS